MEIEHEMKPKELNRNAFRRAVARFPALEKKQVGGRWMVLASVQRVEIVGGSPW